MVEETPPQSMEEADAALLEGAPEGATAPAAEPAAQPEQPRDEQGRFTTAPEAEPEAPVEGEPVPAPDAPVEPTEPGEGDLPEPEANYPVFTYRADGQDFDIPGSLVGEGGVFLPDAAVPEIQQLLSAGKAAFGSVRQRLNDAASREQQALDRAAAAEAQAQKVLATFEDLVEKSQHAQTIEDLANSPLGQWLLGVRQNWPILKAQAEAKAVELKNQQATKELETYRSREQEQRLQPAIEATLRDSVWNQGAALGLDEQTLTAVYNELRQPDMREYIAIKAPFDDPMQGFRRGELVMNHGVVLKALRLASVNRAAPAQQEKIAQAQAANAKAAAPPKKVPPTVGGKGRAPQAGTGVPAFKSTRDVDDWFEKGGYNELETGE